MCVNFLLCLISDKEKRKNLETNTEKPLSLQGLKKETKKKNNFQSNVCCNCQFWTVFFSLHQCFLVFSLKLNPHFSRVILVPRVLLAPQVGSEIKVS